MNNLKRERTFLNNVECNDDEKRGRAVRMRWILVLRVDRTEFTAFYFAYCRKLKQLGRKGRISWGDGGSSQVNFIQETQLNKYNIFSLNSRNYYSRAVLFCSVQSIGWRFYDKHFEFLINKCSEEKAKDKHEKCTKPMT